MCHVSFEEGKFFCLFVSFLFRCTYKDGRVDHDAVSDLGVSSWLFAVKYLGLEPQRTICKWMFGETTIFYFKIWNHPVETTIYKWLALGFQGENIVKP